MKDLKTYINEDKWDDYIDRATELFINIVDKYVDWNSSRRYDSYYNYAIKFDSTITEKDMEDIYKQLSKNKDIIATHECDYDWSEKKYLIVNIFKEGQFKIVLNKTDNKYYVYLMNRSKTYFEKNYK